MSEDDRATKAARAKALLKKRQQKKVVDAQSDHPSTPSRTATPSIPEPVDEKRSIVDLFGPPNSKNDSDTSWLTTLPRAPSPPGRVTTPVAVTSTKSAPLEPETIVPTQNGSSPGVDNLRKELESLRLENDYFREKVQQLGNDYQRKDKKLEELLTQERSQYQNLEGQLERQEKEAESRFRNHEETISLLVSEKAALTLEIHRLDEVETRAQAAEESLGQERGRASALTTQLDQLRERIESVSQSYDQLQRKEKERNEKFREQERQLQLATASASEARKDAERYQRSLKELEEQVQNDDRLERVEASLKNTQERADELEFQLSKLKNSHAQLKMEKESLEFHQTQTTETKQQLENQLNALQKEHESTLNQLNIVVKERDSLANKQASLEESDQSKDGTIATLNSKLLQTSMVIDTHKKQVQTLQAELKAAQKRLDESEKSQQRLQSEGTNLMHSLDELRPKVVELTEDKLQLSERVAHLEHTLRDCDSIILALETKLNEAQQATAKVHIEWESKLKKLEKEHSETSVTSTEMEKDIFGLRNELEDALSSIHSLEAERQCLRQDSQSRHQELEILTNLSRAQAAEIAKLQYELNERRSTQEEEEEFLEEAQNEIDSLRTELASKTSELKQLQNHVHSPSSQNGVSPQSLEAEMLNSLRQQHVLDLSAAQSQIRALENSVFDAEARAHTLQKQVHALEAQLRPSSRLGQRSFSPSRFSRPSSRVQSHSELGRSSFSNSQRPPPLSRSIFDHHMTAETRHKRKVSLSMLKARIDSEVVAHIGSGPPSRALSPVNSRPSSPSQEEFPYNQRAGHHPQFLDESHVFWCSSCSGELVVL